MDAKLKKRILMGAVGAAVIVIALPLIFSGHGNKNEQSKTVTLSAQIPPAPVMPAISMGNPSGTAIQGDEAQQLSPPNTQGATGANPGQTAAEPNEAVDGNTATNPLPTNPNQPAFNVYNQPTGSTAAVPAVQPAPVTTAPVAATPVVQQPAPMVAKPKPAAPAKPASVKATPAAAKPITLSAAATAVATSTPATTATKPVAAAPKAVPVVTATPVAGQWLVQVGSFSMAQNAENLAGRLKGYGLPAFTQAVTTSQGQVTRVVIGPEPTRAAADAVVATLQQQYKVSAVAIPVGQ